MIISIDFDEVLAIRHEGTLFPRAGAKATLESFERAGHTVLLFSPRTNRARQHLAEFDPLVRLGATNDAQDAESRVGWARLDAEMRAFVAREFPGLIDAIDDGHQGAPCVDLHIGRRVVSIADVSWAELANLYGEPA